MLSLVALHSGCTCFVVSRSMTMDGSKMDTLSMIEQLISERNLLEDEYLFGPSYKRRFIRRRIKVIMRQVVGLMCLVEWKK